ncbi:MAG: 4Fe-4S dicluster domain-containing protein [Desulfovibrio sp.]|jgi:Fe-S oxidoreductase|nr:4Fe-4S dicluster domain-containing protein [Desulfovibrio sp.]
MTFDQARLHEIEARCTQESPPGCQGVCPFQLDVRAFLAAMTEGRLVPARRILDRALPLPGIMAAVCDHPCEGVCPRKGLGGSVAVNKLEQACLAATSPTRIPPQPRKKFSLAVMGAGLAGLVAAADLARKGYSITLFHNGEPASLLCSRFPVLADSGALRADMEALVALEVAFAEARLDAPLISRCVQTFDALLLDADAASEPAPPPDDVDAATLLWHDTVCCAGWPSLNAAGRVIPEASRQAGEGRRAAQTLERIVGKVSLTAERDKKPGVLHVPLEGVSPVPRLEAEAEGYTPDEAAREAGRCIQCQCLICVKECVFLQKHKGYPRTYARQAYNNASIVQGFHTANTLINGCALCGQCERLCPERFSMADLCRSAREDMVERNYMPPSAHEFALEDMESACGPECALVLNDIGLDKGGKPSWLFFPGCQLTASRGEQTLELYEHLRSNLSGGVALTLSCCGIPAQWAGRRADFDRHAAELLRQWENFGRPTLIAACASCLKALRSALPEAGLVSAWEILTTLSLPPGRRHYDAFALSIHDPCAARFDAAWLKSVRALVRACGATPEEPRLTGETTPCCGYGGLVFCAAPDVAAEMSAARAADLPHTALASCIMCRDRLANQDKACLHLLDLLFPRPSMSDTQAAAARGPSFSTRRAGRAALRRRVLREYLGRQTLERPAERLTVPPQTLTRLEERHILLEDVESVVAQAERGGRYFENLQNGRRLASSRPRHVTFWVEYSRDGETVMVHDAWMHRMIVPGAGDAGTTPGGRHETGQTPRENMP